MCVALMRCQYAQKQSAYAADMNQWGALNAFAKVGIENETGTSMEMH